jgi:hypothetical protein
MNINEIQKAIHDLAMAVRKGELDKYPQLQALRQKYREMMGVPEAPTPKPEVADEAKPQKKNKKNKE